MDDSGTGPGVVSGPRPIASGASIILRPVPLKRRRRLISSTDLRALALFAIYRFASRWDRPAALSWLAASMPIKRLRSEGRRRAAGLSAFFGDAKASAILAMCESYRSAFSRHALIYVAERDSRLPGLKVSVVGTQRLDAALAAQHGAVLWCDNFLFASHLGKKALKENGRAVHHVTAVDHGYSLSRMGRVLFNAWQIDVEERYVASWLRFDPDSGDDIRPRIESCLRRNQLVSITNTTVNGYRFIDMDIGENAIHRIPVGPLDIALRMGTPILPCAVVEDEPLRHYRLIIGEDLRGESHRNGPMPVTDDARAAMVENYRRWLSPLISAYPDQWVPASSLRRRTPDVNYVSRES